MPHMSAARTPAGLTGEPPSWFTEALAVPAEDRHVRVNGASVSYRAWGTPGTRGAVLVHGTAAHARWWDHIAPFLQADGMRVAAISISGHGDSDHRDLYSLDQWAAEVVAVAADAGIAGSPFLIGHSLGGHVAVRTAALHGASLGGVIVIDSIVFEDSPPPELHSLAMGFGAARTYPTREAVTARFRLVPEHPVLPYVREHVAAGSVTVKDNGEWGWKFDQSLFSKMEQPSRPFEAKVGCQVAILRGQHGLMTPAMAAQLGDWVGQSAPVAEIPAAGHHVLLDQPLSLVAALRAVLAGWSAARPPE
jgi:pimeloyl-ACP methyl ester carboxylesterase